MRKFTEAISNISNDSIKEFIQTFMNMGEDMLINLEKVNVIRSTLTNYTSPDIESNDQIDNTVFELDYLIESINEITTRIDTINSHLNSYREDGRKQI